MDSLGVEIIANSEHPKEVERLLGGRPWRVRLCALNVRDIQLNTMTLRSRLFKLLASGECTVTVAYGERLLKRERPVARDESCRQTLRFLHDLRDRGARVHRVPRLHAKVVYVEERTPERGNSKSALITSANLTDSGMRRNRELGVTLRDLDSHAHVEKCVRDFTTALLGSPRDLEEEET